MQDGGLISSMFVIFFGAAVLATLALYTRQSLLVTYMLLGIIAGPDGLKFVNNPAIITQISNVGILFLLFLLGLDLQPQILWHMIRNASWITAVASSFFYLFGFLVAFFFGYSPVESAIVGVSMMFSSTILGIKLMPSTILHQKRVGELVISILLLQDLLAIIVLLIMTGIVTKQEYASQIINLLFAFIGLLVVSVFLERFLLRPLLQKFQKLQEYVFLVAIGWCLSFAEIAQLLNLSYEIGAFIAGVSIATSPISLFIAERLKPLRDFFLVLFFFSLGATLDLQSFHLIIIPASILTILVIILKPLTFRSLFIGFHESSSGWQVAIRLGQCSEFSLLVGYSAYNLSLINSETFYLIQTTTLFTLIISAYIIERLYPSSNNSNASSKHT